MSSDMSHFCCLVFFIVFVVAILGILLWDFFFLLSFFKRCVIRGGAGELIYLTGRDDASRLYSKTKKEASWNM